MTKRRADQALPRNLRFQKITSHCQNVVNVLIPNKLHLSWLPTKHLFEVKHHCQLAETLVSFLLLQQLSEDFYYYLSCWLVLQYVYWLSEKLQRCLSDHKIKAFFKPMRTIGDKLRNRTPLLESPFALMKACCQLAETLVSFLLSQQLSEEDFYYYLSCWLVLQYVKHHCCNEATYSWCFCTDIIFFTVINKKIARYL